MKIGLTPTTLHPHRAVGDLLLDDPPAPPCGCRASPRVDIYGERLKQRHIQVDPAKLASPRHHDRAASWRPGSEGARRRRAPVRQELHSSAQGGFVEFAGRRLNIENVQPITESRGPRERWPSPSAATCVVRMADLGRAWQDHQQLWGEGVVNGGPGSAADRREVPWREHVEVTWRRRVIEELKAGLPGVAVDGAIFRPATFIQLSIDHLTKALLGRRPARHRWSSRRSSSSGAPHSSASPPSRSRCSPPCSCSTCAARRSTSWSSRAWWSRRGGGG